MDIAKFVKAKCRETERRFGIKIIFCVESGSRLWRIASADSDYDVRFVFAYPLQRYISLQKPSEVIELKFETEHIEMLGFDIFKYARLLADSNPTAIEWILSDINYYGRKPLSFRHFALRYFNSVKLYYHYCNLAKDNYKKYIASNKDVTAKRYLYVLRGIANAMAVQKNILPLMNFQKQLERTALPKKVKNIVLELINTKRTSKEKQVISRMAILDAYIKQFLAKEQHPKEPRPQKEALALLDSVLKRTLKR